MKPFPGNHLCLITPSHLSLAALLSALKGYRRGPAQGPQCKPLCLFSAETVKMHIVTLTFSREMFTFSLSLSLFLSASYDSLWNCLIVLMFSFFSHEEQNKLLEIPINRDKSLEGELTSLLNNTKEMCIQNSPCRLLGTKMSLRMKYTLGHDQV